MATKWYRSWRARRVFTHQLRAACNHMMHEWKRVEEAGAGDTINFPNHRPWQYRRPWQLMRLLNIRSPAAVRRYARIKGQDIQVMQRLLTILGIPIVSSYRIFVTSALLVDANGQVSIGINLINDELEQQIYAAAYRLGCMLLWPSIMSSTWDLDRYDSTTPERCVAHRFARELLIPKRGFRSLFYTVEGNLDLLARYYGVPRSVMNTRYMEIFHRGKEQ